MNEFKEIRKCYGCGEILQTEDPKAPGYIPLSAYDNKEILLCRRCFRLQHYSEDIKEGPEVSDDFFKILKQAQKEKAIFVYVIDLFSFEASFVKTVNEYIRGSNVILVANKRDVLPKSISDEKLIEYVKAKANQEGLKVSDLIILSSKKNYNIDELRAAIGRIAKKNNIYVIGATSAGKSTLINAFLKNYTNETHKLITTSCYPGTTMRVIAVPLDDETTMYDTPGLSIDNSMISHVEKEVIKVITPNKEIKPRTFQLNDKQSLLLGGLARFDFIKGHRTGFTVYAANEVQIHRCKLDHADTTFNAMIKYKRIKPSSGNFTSTKDFDTYEITIDNGKVDIGIYGFGWISFSGKGQVIRVHAPKGVSIYKTDAKI